MKVVEVTVNAGRTFNHPFEQYSNLRPSVTVRAELAAGEDYREAVKTLQAQAEQLVEDHKQHMLASLEQLEQMRQREREIARLEQLIKTSQTRLEAVRDGADSALLFVEDNR